MPPRKQQQQQQVSAQCCQPFACSVCQSSVVSQSYFHRCSGRMMAPDKVLSYHQLNQQHRSIAHYALVALDHKQEAEQLCQGPCTTAFSHHCLSLTGRHGHMCQCRFVHHTNPHLTGCGSLLQEPAAEGQPTDELVTRNCHKQHQELSAQVLQAPESSGAAKPRHKGHTVRIKVWIMRAGRPDH